MNGNHYHDPILNELRDLLEKHGPKDLKGKYYLGDSMVVEKAKLPMCFITYEKQEVVDDASHSIETHATILINVAYDLTKDFGGQNKQSSSHMALNRYLCGRDEQNNLLEDSILAVLRKFEDHSKLRIELGSTSQIEYGYGERGQNVFTNEAVLRTTVRTRQIVSSDFVA